MSQEYNFVLIIAIPSNGEVEANQLQTNILRVQRYAFELKECPHVIVGSSETARIPSEVVSDDLNNLALSSESALTGPEIISNKEDKPDIVFVELNNSIMKNVDDVLVNKTSRWNFLYLIGKGIGWIICSGACISHYIA